MIFLLHSLDSEIHIVSADKAIMYFKLDFKINTLTFVQTPLLHTYNKRQAEGSRILIFPLQIGWKKEAACHEKMNSVFCLWSPGQKWLNFFGWIIFSGDGLINWNLMKHQWPFHKICNKELLFDRVCQSVLGYCSIFFFFFPIGIWLGGPKQTWHFNYGIVKWFSFNIWTSQLEIFFFAAPIIVGTVRSKAERVRKRGRKMASLFYLDASRSLSHL